tara:strand:- start:546 stop:692 length:147 start_codon:yes stop_codon:yes gene_type:complete
MHNGVTEESAQLGKIILVVIPIAVVFTCLNKSVSYYKDKLEGLTTEEV